MGRQDEDNEEHKNMGGGFWLFSYLLLKFAEFIVLPLSILVYLLLSFVASILDALGSVYAVSPCIRIWRFLFSEVGKPIKGRIGS